MNKATDDQSDNPLEAFREYVPGVPVEELGAAVDQGTPDPGWKEIKTAEMAYIRKRRGDGDGRSAPEGDPGNLSGLSLSGGGIRSATFSLGVMQALAKRGLLEKMDYLSTVSGGGYIGSGISWLVSAEAEQECAQSENKSKEDKKQSTGSWLKSVPGWFGLSGSAKKQPAGETSEFKLGMSKEAFPFGTDDPTPDSEREDSPVQRHLLKYLREHGYYLTPGKGVNAISLLAVALRGTLLNLVVWIPAFILFFVVGFWGFEQVPHLGSGTPSKGSTEQESVALPSPVLSTLLEKVRPDRDCITAPASTPGVPLAPCTPSQIQAAKDAHKAWNEVNKRRSALFGFELALWVSILSLGILLVGSAFYSLGTWVRRGWPDTIHRLWYGQRRIHEKVAAFLIPVAVVALVIGTLPVVGVYLHGWFQAAGPAALVTGIAMTFSRLFSLGTKGDGSPPGPIVSLGAGLFLYGVFLVSYEVAFAVFPFGSHPFVELATLTGLVLLFGWFVNLNYISIHRYYRDRLMESFMPDVEAALINKTGRAVGADAATLTEVGSMDDPRGPYHIVNTTAILVNSEVRSYAQRGGDNFILSPLYCGSNATGWRRTDKFMDGKMTLATAMAISGAALNPNSGVGGEGLTRNRMLSLVMSLLNLRLSYWAHHPDPKKQPGNCPNHLRPGSYSFGNALRIWGYGFNENQPFIQISDGGQFENNAVYELVRRRLGLIIVCDGGADPDFSFSDFQTTVRRIEDDFGVQVKIHSDASPNQMIPSATDKDKQPSPSYPMGAGFAEQGYMVCTIKYNTPEGGDPQTGTLLFLKTTLIEDVSFRVKGYVAQNPDFPDQSTADQFFDEVQFESYRELGYRIASQMLDNKMPTEVDADVAKQEQTIGAFIAEYCGRQVAT